MASSATAPQPVLRVQSPAQATLYLSTSWQPDKGLDMSYRLVRHLDQNNIRVVGDAKGLRHQVPGRLLRIMADCDGFLSVLPFRPQEPTGTSPFMLAELRLAIQSGLPMAILYDSRIPLQPQRLPGEKIIAFGAEAVQVPESLLLAGPQSYDLDVESSEAQAEAAIVRFRDHIASEHQRRAGDSWPAYAFLITRLKEDFRLARHAIACAVEKASGLPCLWIDAAGYSSNISNTVERTRLLIEHAQFVVADISFTEDNPNTDNPTRAHEIGIATAYGKKIFFTAQNPRRDPYHSITAAQVLFWSDEAQLHAILAKAIDDDRQDVGRHTYNWDLPRPGDRYSPALKPPEFRPTEGRPHTPPSASELSSAESWLLAAAFAVLALCISILLERYTDFTGGLDLASIVAAIFVLTFSSDLSKAIRRQIARSPLLKWSVVALALALLLVTLLPERAKEEQDPSPGKQSASPPARPS